MEGGQLNIPFTILNNSKELREDERLLLNFAKEAWKNAYAPFSDFLVGCALLLENGEQLFGSNQENKAFPSGICAERAALFHAGSLGKGKLIQKIAITAKSLNRIVNQPVTPCGACRQVMLEYEQMAGRPFIILMQGEEGPILRLEGVAQSLLPFGFDIDF